MSTTPHIPDDWTKSDVYESPMEICWQFDYEISSEKLANLYSKSKKLQWDAEQDLDWSIEVDPSKPIIEEERFGFNMIPFIQKLSKTQRDTFTAHVGAQRLSQFLHGEQGALMTAAALTHAVPDYEGKLYAATQTMDEARHVEAFEKYLRKLAIVYPVSPFLKKLIDTTLKADHWVKIAIGMNMVVEGLALGAFHNMRRATSCELMRSLVEGVLRDESRHVAFGNVYVGATIKDLHDDEKEDVAQFAFDALMMMAEATGRRKGKPPQPDPTFRLVLEHSEIDPGDFMKGMLEARQQGIKFDQPPGTVHAFKDLMMPALVRVGAVTDRTRAMFAEEGIRVFEDTSVLESMEDAETGDLDAAEAAD
ncbi:MAG: ferritin-like domain-containing protein [Myxococcales bacterium]|nr:ferritin-like domain-containing protein [Myxococcales bacterium]